MPVADRVIEWTEGWTAFAVILLVAFLVTWVVTDLLDVPRRPYVAIAFLLTGNVLAPVVAHVVLHGQLILRGVELPPVTAPRSRLVAA